MAEPAPVRYFNRHTGRVETEAVYGEPFLRFSYGNPLGRLALHALVKRAAFSRWYGWRMNRPASRRKIAPFLRKFGIDASEFADPPESFRSFNEFFVRRLKAGARPVDPDPRAAVFPADGRHFGWSRLAAADVVVKGQRFDVDALLGDPALADRHRDGPAVLSRLCPVDYHRFHFPVAGVASAPERLEGWLFSVNPIALRVRVSALWENRRWRSGIETAQFGRVTMVEIGATCVGATEYTFTPGAPVAKGAGKGFFKFGASAVLTLFEPERLQLAEDLVTSTAGGLELFARMGERLGTAPC